MRILLLALSLMLFSFSASAETQAAKILIEKSERRLTLIDAEGNNFASYSVSLGFAPEGHKTQQGDGKTPEGMYSISGRNEKSSFYRSLRISYPNSLDKAQAKKRNVEPGGDIMIHGLPNGLGWMGKTHLARDWTHGCIALTNEEMDVLWQSVAMGAPVEIRP